MKCKLCANDSEHGTGLESSVASLAAAAALVLAGAFEGTTGAGHIEYRAWAHAAVVMEGRW